MQLTTEILTPYVGGQMEIQNQDEEYLFRGEVKTIAVEDGKLRVVFSWLAKAEGYPIIPDYWTRNPTREYRVTLAICAVSNIGPSGEDIGGGDRLCLTSPLTGETAVLFPRDGSKLDPSKIKDPVLAQA